VAGETGKMWAIQPDWSDAQLAAITSPVWIVDGDLEEFIRQGQAGHLAATIPHAGLLILPMSATSPRCRRPRCSMPPRCSSSMDPAEQRQWRQASVPIFHGPPGCLHDAPGFFARRAEHLNSARRALIRTSVLLSPRVELSARLAGGVRPLSV
jgi:hypothetical protein